MITLIIIHKFLILQGGINGDVWSWMINLMNTQHLFLFSFYIIKSEIEAKYRAFVDYVKEALHEPYALR